MGVVLKWRVICCGERARQTGTRATDAEFLDSEQKGLVLFVELVCFICKEVQICVIKYN